MNYIELTERYGSQRAAAEALGVAKSTFNDGYRRQKAREGQDPAILSAMDALGTDLVPQNGWLRGKDGDGNKFTLHLRPEQKSTESLIEAVKRGLSDCIKVEATPAPSGTGQSLKTYYNIADLHLGLLCWAEEVGENWNSSLASSRLYTAMSELVSHTPPSEEAVILNLGDLSHANDNNAQTPASKHNLDVDSRFFKVMRLATALMKEVIKLALQKHKKVTYRGLRGNHDETAHVCVTLALYEHFENEPRVEIDASPSDYFIDQWGLNMIVAHHGDKMPPNRLVMFASDQWAQIWGETYYRFGWTGHVHHDSAKDIGGMRVESFRTIIPRDAYAFSHAYTSRQTMQAITLHKEEGEIMRNKVNFRPRSEGVMNG